MKARFAAAVAAFLISSSAQAVLVDLTELPAPMQTCFSYGGTCWGSSVISPPMPGATTSLISSYDLPNMSAFQYKDGTTDKWLIRYDALAPSHASGSSYDSFTNISSSYNSALTGHLWLSANQSYDLTSSNHLFNLYFDKLSPSISFMNGLTSAHFDLSTTDLLAGGGYSQISNYGNNSQGSLISGPGPDGIFGINYWSCIECDTTVQFNLAMLKYSISGTSAQLGFIPADPQSIVFKESEYHPDFGYGSSSSEVAVYVQPVPLPSGLWLLISGLAGLNVLVRKRYS